MRQLYFLLFMFFVSGILWGKPVTITVSGFVFDETTGRKAAGQLITLKARNINPPFVYFEKLVTDSSGFFNKTIEFPYPKGVIEVSTIDCNNQRITHHLNFNYNKTNLTTSFVICYNPELSYCRSDFLFLPDQKKPGAFHFKETSLGDIQNYSWNFGDGSFSSLPNPVHTYVEDGNYSVCLTINGNNGTCNDLFCESIIVLTDSVCAAMFTYSENYGTFNTIQFWDISQGDISAWLWDFGDGTTSTNQYPSHTYASQGSYEVCLTVGNSSGTCSDNYCTEVITGSNNDCKAMFFSLNDTVDQFSWQFIDVSYGQPDSWQWSFGDGTYSEAQNPEHTFGQAGMYNVCLAIYSDSSGCSNTYCQTIIVDPQIACTAYFSFSEISSQPFTYQFVDLSVGNIENRIWDFGDGKTVNETNPTHTYYQSGEYQVCLSISDGQGNCSDVFCETIYVDIIPDCSANFVYLQDETNPFTFNFSDNSTGEIINWNWDFGDGTTSSGQNPVHTFTEEGFYVVCLDVADSTGQCSDQLCSGIFVTGEFPCQAGFDFEILPEDPLSVQFTDTSIGNIGFWLWDFGDGNFSFEQNPLHAFPANGIYNVCLKVLDFNFQCSNLFCQNIEINYNPGCEAGFDYLPSPGDLFTYNFIDNSTGNIVGWLWTFGDGNSSDLQNPAHTFASDGTFEVCLTVTNFWGNCQDIFCTNVVIEIPELCVADFGFSTIPDLPLNVAFIDFSTGIMTQWLWDFGDGNTSGLQNPVHVFPDTGIYQVTLSIQNTDSLLFCNNSITKQVPVYVAVPDCHANFIACPDSGVNKPNLFHFDDISTGSPDLWYWDFGDGSTSTLQNPSHKFDDFGDYEVSLTITTQNPWGDDCTDSKILQFSSPEYYHFGGMVYAGDYPINNPTPNGDTAQVFVYRYQNNTVQPVDTNLFTNLGYFYFLNVLPSDYLIKVNLTRTSTNTENYFPSYFGDHFKWQNAATLQLADSCQYHADVNLIRIIETETGAGNISGNVVHHNEKFFAFGPASNTEILLFDNSGNPVKYCFSDNSGDFSFNSLPYGTYILQAESTGLFTDPLVITLTETSPSANGVQLDLYDADITAVNQPSDEKMQISISPNPVKERFYLNLQSSQNQNIRIIITGIAGDKIVEFSQTVSTGKNAVPLTSGNLSKGIYFLKVVSDDGSINKTLKFIR